jgi:hypothetical protein
MRVFCPEHKRGFFAPRQNPIKCENRGHLLGELDFEGEGRVPAEIGWLYCCNCEHFCPVDFDQNGLERCPVCTRRSSLLYLCDRCHVITFESNTPLQTKNFTLSAEGVPQPSCPGCLRPASSDLHEHSCEGLGAVFVTALDTCPVCHERLDILPGFPSTVALFLKRTRSSNKTSVTFDYETESFVPVEDGEFVIVTNPQTPAIVLPRAPRFAARRDFYEYYQDYYHCANPDAGEVQIVEPAIVSRAANGWKLETMGLLEVLPEHPRKKIVPVVNRDVVVQPPRIEPRIEPAAPRIDPRIEPAAPRVESKAAPIEPDQTEVTPCSECGAMVESRYSFCWKCGNPLTSQTKQSRGNGPTHGTLLSSAIDDDELTVQHEMRPASAPLFSWSAPAQTDHPSASRGSVLKLMAIGGVALLLLSLGLFGLTRSASPVTTASSTPAPNAAAETQQQQQAPATAATTAPASTNGPQAAPTDAQTQPSPTASPEDELLARLRERRMTASGSERNKVLEVFAKIERRYPRDYRFPYERAKLAAKGSQSDSRDEAFKALSVAAERAISAGKANEMLNGLESDKEGDFHRLAQGRQEWTRLVVALKRKDPTLLRML